MPPTIFPKLVHELAQGAGPSTSAPTWTDISADVRNLQVKRGRQHILQRFEAGTATYDLWNSDGRYNPTNTASPYYPNILPMMPVRTRAWWNFLSQNQSVLNVDATGFTDAVNCSLARVTSPLPGLASGGGAPTVTAVSPISGSTAGGTSVSVTGTGFTGATKVMFGGTPATSFVVNSSVSITATAPAATASATSVDIVVTTPSGSSITSPADEWTWTFSNGGFSITLSASTNSPTVGSNVTLTGTANQNVGPTPYGLSLFDVTTGTELLHTSTGTTISTVVNQAAASTHRYVALVCNVLGGNPQAASAPQVVVWGTGATSPTVTAVAPPSGSTAGGTSVGLTGTGFTGATQVYFGLFPATSFVVNSSVSITAVAPPGTGATNISVVTANGQSPGAAGNLYLYSPYGTIGSLRLTSTAAGDMAAAVRYTADQTGDSFGTWDESKGVPVQPGQTVTLLAGFQAAASGRTVRVDAQWRNAAGSVTTTATGPTGTDITSGFTQVRNEQVVPAGAAFVVPVPTVVGTGGASEIHYVSNVGVYPAPGVNNFSAGGPYGIFRGFVESWPQDWPDVATAGVQMTAVDAFKVFSYFNLKTPWVMTVTAVPPTIWYRFQETTGAFSAVDSSGNANNGIYPPSGLTFGVASPIADSGAKAIIFPAGSIGVTGPKIGLGQQAFTMGVWLKASGHSTFFTDLLNSGDITWRFALTAVGQLYFKGGGLGGGAGGPDLTDNTWHLAVVTRDSFGSGNNVLVYADTTSLVLGTNVTFFGSLPFCAGDDISGGGGTGVTLAEPFLIVGTNLTAAQVSALFSAGPAWAGDTFGARVNHVLDRMSWPAGLRAVDTGSSVFQGSPEMTGSTGRDHLQLAADSEQGAIFVSGFGNVSAYGRTRPIVPPGNVSVATFGDGGGSEIPFLLSSKTALVLDDLDVYNEAIMGRNNGPQQVSEIPSSQAIYGVRSLQQTNLLNQTDAEVLAGAQNITFHGATPLPRLTAVVVNPHSAPDLAFPQVLGLEIRNRVTVNRRAPGGTAGPNLFSQQAVIEGLQLTFTGDKSCEANYALSAAETATYFILDHPTFGLLDSGNVLSM